MINLVPPIGWSGNVVKSLSARNPLGVIALFISLIYGVSALLLGVSVTDLAPHNQDRLIWFIISFPVAILCAFIYLVTWHHRKLYGPADFRSDEGFLSSADPTVIGRKYLEESGSDAGSRPDGRADHDPPRQDPVGVEDGKFTADPPGGAARKNAPSRLAASFRSPALSYMLEGLVMQELQSEFESPIRRDTKLVMADGRRAQVDGIIETRSGPILVEVKRVGADAHWRRRVMEGLDMLRRYLDGAEAAGVKDAQAVLAVVHSDSMSPSMRERLADQHARSGGRAVDMRLFSEGELLAKYGLAEAGDLMRA